jgi:DNA polymerase I-like protein with 3'-5' exonuclease and polymerase domains
MIVTRDNLSSVLQEIASAPQKGFDTETTGLDWHKGDRLFSFVVTVNENRGFYFNFNDAVDIPYDAILPRDIIEDVAESLKGLLFIHRAKFDMHMLANEGINLLDPAYTIHCTEAIGRVECNDHFSYSLDNLAKINLGIRKDDKVKEYCDKNKLFSYVEIEGKREKKYHFEKVPFDLIAPYTIQDGRIVYLLGVQQTQSIKMQSEAFGGDPLRSPIRVMENERKLTKVLWKMERKGMKLNTAYTRRAHNHEVARANKIKEEFESISGKPFKDSGKLFAEIYEEKGWEYPRTEKGNPCFDADALELMDNPIANLVKELRGCKKYQDYYLNFLRLMSPDEVIHSTFNQGGTGTGRMSAADPNLQNLTKVEKEDPEFNWEFLVRRCFVPRKGKTLFMLDYDQMEYRLMLDYSGEIDVINKVLNGTDVHIATAEMMGTNRKEAKTINFMLLYGGGVAKLCLAICKPTLTEKALKDLASLMFNEKLRLEELKSVLGKQVRGRRGDVYDVPHTFEALEHNYNELMKAKAKRDLYKAKLPKVASFVDGVIETAKKRGYIFNWMGRKCIFKKEHSYAAPNYLIQGGCADVVKLAMLGCDDLLTNTKSCMLAQVHDELIFEIDDNEYHLVPKLREIMSNVYKPKHLPLTCGVDYSKLSWQDKREFNGEEAGNSIQGKSNEEAESVNAGGLV